MPTLEEAIQNIRMGNNSQGRQILEALLDEDENNEDIWLWMSTVVDGDEDREICLENVLALNPKNTVARNGLEALKSGVFNTDDLLQDLIDSDGLDEDDEGQPATFIDDFVFIDDDLDDDDLLLPGERKKGSRFNVRYLILGVLVLILLVVLGVLAATSLLLLGNDNGGDSTAPAGNATEQQAPAVGETPEPTATATETPMPSPTDTPAVTNTPKLQLPTAAPTRTPSPTATTVVSPTPIK